MTGRHHVRKLLLVGFAFALGTIHRGAQAQLNANSSSYAFALVQSGLRLKYSTTQNGTYQDIGDLTLQYFEVNRLPNHGQGYYQIGFDTMPADIDMQYGGLGVGAGQTVHLAKISSVSLFNVDGFSSYTLGTNVSGGQNTGVQLFNWSDPAQPISGSWNSVTHTDSGQSHPFDIGYEDNVNGLFSNKQDWSGGSPHPRYGDFQFTNWSPVNPNTPTYIAMDVMTTTGFTGRIFIVPETTFLQMAVLLALGGTGLWRLRRRRREVASATV